MYKVSFIRNSIYIMFSISSGYIWGEEEANSFIVFWKILGKILNNPFKFVVYVG
jgi:hypothetical protein